MNSKCNPNRYYGRQPGQYVYSTYKGFYVLGKLWDYFFTNLNWDLVLYLEGEEPNVSYPISLSSM